MWLMWFPFFGTWWWLFSLLFLVLIITAEERDYAGGAFWILVGYITLITVFGEGIAILKWIGNHPFWSFLGVILYALLGVPWARFWWKWKQTEKREEYNEFRRKFLLKNNVISVNDNHLDFQIPDHLLVEWNNSNSMFMSHLNKRVFWTEHKDTLVCAMTWWPIHFASFFLKDFITTGWRRLLLVFRAVFDRVDNETWSDVEQDFRVATDEQKAESRRRH